MTINFVTFYQKTHIKADVAYKMLEIFKHLLVNLFIYIV